MESRENAVVVYRNELDKFINSDFDFEIDLHLWQKILVLFLNILTGGLGTILVPFLNRKRKSVNLIIVGIILGILQIFHFLHFFSLLRGIKILERFYDYISDDNFLLLFFKNTKDEKHDDYTNISNKFFDINFSGIIAKKLRIKYLKILFGIISGMSYANSLFTVLVNFIAKKEDQPNYKLGIKTLLYNIFNPGAGLLISSIVLVDSIKCNSFENFKNFIISFIGIIISIILLICPFIACLGVYLILLTSKYIEIYEIKLLLNFIGFFGMILSLSFSTFTKNAIFESIKKEKNHPFDIAWKYGETIINAFSEFSFITLLLFVMNILLPGTGTFCLICKYKGSFGKSCIILSIFHFYSGLFFLCLYIIIKTELSGKEIRIKRDNEPKTYLEGKIKYIYEMEEDNFNFVYTIAFFGYMSQFYMILISDFLHKRNHNVKKFILYSLTFLNLFTGGLGTLFYLDLYYYKGNKFNKCKCSDKKEDNDHNGDNNDRLNLNNYNNPGNRAELLMIGWGSFFLGSGVFVAAVACLNIYLKIALIILHILCVIFNTYLANNLEDDYQYETNVLTDFPIHVGQN